MEEVADQQATGPDTEAVFGLLSDERRLEIMRALYAADGPLSFSALHERVETVDSGQFNYHLGKLTGTFVEKSEDGYTLSHAGLRVLGSVFAGSYDDEATVDPVPVEGECYECGGTIAVGYDRDHLSARCTDCETRIVAYPAPPGILRGRPREELPAAFGSYLRTVIGQLHDRFCPLCLAATETELDEGDVFDVAVTYHCQHCRAQYRVPVAATVLDTPEVITFVQENGVDPESVTLWTVAAGLETSTKLRPEGQDHAVELSLTVDGETLTLWLDDSLSVVESSRS